MVSLVPFIKNSSHPLSDFFQKLQLCGDQCNIRIFDYECMVNENNFRVLAFGKFAGYSGMINILHGLGQRLLALGHTTPFMNVAMPHNYSSLELARQAIKMAGYGIAMNQMPSSIGPIIFVFTGQGNVSQGARAIFRLLPHKFILPSEMKETAMHGSRSSFAHNSCLRLCACFLFGAQVTQHVCARPSTASNTTLSIQFDPRKPNDTFGDKGRSMSDLTLVFFIYAPYMSVLVNGIFWRVTDPRLLSIEDCKRLMVTGKPCHQHVSSTGRLLDSKQ
ncbi:unnamed protein product [Dibothriocephalus latus]|uniref:Uncharacterized protein n=1 Tax=Dibothriocephalus latus TaxID=60516 RepID=A0A3P6QWM3_DIBLA|nr:unnamed protein product [Dibothriocephalus latus]